MRLLVLNYEYVPVGGKSGIITKEIAEALLNRGHKISIVTTWYDGEPENYRDGDLHLIRVRSRRKNKSTSNPLEMLSWISKSKKFLEDHLKTEKYDLCIANFALPGGEVAYSMKLLYKLPYVVITYGYDIPWLFPEKMMWYHAVTYHWIRKICLQSEQNYVPSLDMKSNMDSFLGNKFSNKNKFIPYVEFENRDEIINEFENDFDRIVFRSNFINSI